MTLSVADVTHAYDGEPVFEDVSLTVDPGEVVALIGPSGVGKSTLLRLLALFEPPTDGRVECDGVDVWDVTESERLAYRRRIGMVFQEANLFDASVRRNVEYGLRIRKPWHERVRHEVANLVGSLNGTAETYRADEALEVVGLGDLAEQDAESLSGGEAQRVAFARALAYEPDVLLLDEPTSDLDPRNTAVIEEAVLEARDRGIGVVVATHDMHQAERIADRAGVLLGSELIELDDAGRVFEDPRDERTRKFIAGELVY
ncbi:amino acid ABC transporter ATP-binding protein [Natrialbaceae archaeon GCM10025810]|uniref:amino acid ABC transporter ATP-binding protein n=1 Tax=Halovalidus salilacus TaxID=3075124 RepID=UPI0036232BEC